MKEETVNAFESRKKDHIKHCLNESVDVSSDQFASIRLTHQALPEINFDEVDIQANLLGHTFSSPIFISSMTAGHTQGKDINQLLAKVCESKNWLFNVGSQRHQLQNDSQVDAWQDLKQQFPNVKMAANLGLSQLIDADLKSVESVLNSIDALALIIHLNPLQEALQMEGTPNFKGGLAKIKTLAESLSVPVVVKETGCGFSVDTLRSLIGSGIQVVDLAGFGGTHWGRVEGLRASDVQETMMTQLSQTFANWGVPTVESLMSLQSLSLDYKVWASGGVRSGLDVAKCLAMGAEAAGIARPILLAALKGEQDLLDLMSFYEQELRVALFCTGSAGPSEIKGKWKWTGTN